MPRPDVMDRCADARGVLFGALADALRPREVLAPSDWAERHRIVSAESGSRYPGPWRNERAPHLVEVMDALSPADPCSDVVCDFSAQTGKSEVGLNFLGWLIDQEPGPTIIVLPSIEESRKYVATKLQPTIDATPRLRRKVLDYTERSGDGSTQSFKRFSGGFAQLTYAGSSKGLQMLSARYTIGDEVTEWPAEVGLRGDPVSQLVKRTTTYERDCKRLWTSTPGVAGACRITAMYERSDQRRRYVPCPHCGAYQVLRFDRLRRRSDSWPHGAWFECAAQGCVIEQAERETMLTAGVWIATAGEGEAGTDRPGDWFEPEELERWRARTVPTRVRGFHLWQAYSLMVGWDSIVAEWLEAEGKPLLERSFAQQVLGEAYEERGDAPDAEQLHKARVLGLHLGEVPPGPLVLTAGIDVQGNRIEWAVWGWGEGLTRWLIDRGIVEGDPNDEATWSELDRTVLLRKWRLAGGFEVGLEATGIDSGHATQAVYNFVRGRPRVFALDGRHTRTMPMIGAPQKVDVTWRGKRVPRGSMMWPVGRPATNADHYAAIRKAIAGPDETGAWPTGAMILPGDVDLAYCEQLTAEHMVRVERQSGVTEYRWQKLAGRPNEAFDNACYARAMAFHLRLDRITAEGWAKLRAERGGVDPAQADLFDRPVAETARAETGERREQAPAAGQRGTRRVVRRSSYMGG